MTYPSILPPGSTPLELSLEQVVALLLDIPVPIPDTWSPDDCPVALLPWLAWALSVDEWDTNWSETQKRSAVKTSLSVHMRKGTIGAVREAMAALSFTARVQEWFNQVPPGDPHTFRLLLEADQVGISQAGFGALLGVIERTKNLRSHLTAIELTVRSQTGPLMVAAAGIGNDFGLTGYVPPVTVLNATTICL